MESSQVNFSPLKYENETLIIVGVEQSAYFKRLSIEAKNNIMHPITCLLATGAKPGVATKNVALAHWLLKMANLSPSHFIHRQITHLKFRDKISDTSELELGLKPY